MHFAWFNCRDVPVSTLPTVAGGKTSTQLATQFIQFARLGCRRRLLKLREELKRPLEGKNKTRRRDTGSDLLVFLTFMSYFTGNALKLIQSPNVRVLTLRFYINFYYVNISSYTLSITADRSTSEETASFHFYFSNTMRIFFFFFPIPTSSVKKKGSTEKKCK